ncbi:hypothetical protein [Desulfitibacter alkalitolerans]|uniref:hypothetical protein n=1 Tax=Desulfitibacter alkalitolerans TaxID=264641 RepID=UPI000485F4F4|nr:hypothetical protein [Desulfitibacter alkalitolerans]
MDFVKTLIIAGSMLVYLGFAPITTDHYTLSHQSNNHYEQKDHETWWEEYHKLPRKSGALADRITQALEYSGWLNEPLEDVIVKLEEFYGEPLLSEIVKSVSEFRATPTDWHYLYKVDSVYLLQKHGEKTYLIVEVLELLNDEIIDKALALIIINSDSKIIEQDFRWGY